MGEVEESVGIEGTGITEEEVVAAIRNAFPKATNLSLDSFTSKLIGLGQGYASNIVRMELNWSGENRAEVPSSLILKVPTMTKFKGLMKNAAERSKEGKAAFGDESMAEMIIVVHNAECMIYDIFKRDPPPFPVAKSYGSRKIFDDAIGFLLLEDLSEHMYIKKFDEGFTKAQLEEIIDHYASVTAWGQRHVKELEVLPPVPDRMWEGMVAIIKPGFDEIRQREPERVGDKVDWVLPHCTVDALKGTGPRMEELGIPKVLVHGDFHAFNLALTTDKSGLRAFLDWQVVHLGSPAEDLGKLIGGFVSRDVRRAETMNLLRRYHHRLEELCDGVAPFSLEALVESFKLMWPFFGGAFLAMLPGLEKAPFLPHLPEAERKALLNNFWERGLAALDDCDPEKPIESWAAQAS